MWPVWPAAITMSSEDLVKKSPDVPDFRTKPTVIKINLKPCNTSNNVTTRASSRVQKDDRGAGGRTEVSWIDAGLTQLRSIYDKMKE